MKRQSQKLTAILLSLALAAAPASDALTLQAEALSGENSSDTSGDTLEEISLYESAGESEGESDGAEETAAETAGSTAAGLETDTAAEKESGAAADTLTEAGDASGEEDGTAVSEETGTAEESDDSDPDAPYSSDELIIVYEEEALSLDDTLDLDSGSASDGLTLEEAGITEQEVILSAEGEDGDIVLAQLDPDASAEELIAELSEDPAIAYVQPNYSYELLETTTDDPYAGNDTSAANQYYLYSSGFTEAWDSVKAEGTVTVAVLDTGCNLEHEDLAGNLNTDLAYNVTTNSLLSESGTANNGDVSGHGTQVCGIISAVANNAVGIAGASYNATILPVCIFDSDKNCSTTDLIAAYDYLDELIGCGAVDDLKVINLSVGYYSTGTTAVDLLVEEAIADMLGDNGVLTVCAGGNSASTAYCFPADFEECISVTSVDESGVNSSFSDYNSEKDISAYGEDILSTSMYGGYTTGSGTSFAAPQVSAAAALVWAADPSLTADEVADILTGTADYSEDAVPSGSGSAGILNAADAVLAAADYSVPGGTTLSSVTLSSSLTSATVKWSKVSGADGYVIYRAAGSGSYKKVKTITGASTVSWTNTSLSLGTTYKYKVRAYYSCGGVMNTYGSWSSAKSVTTKPSKVTISSAAVTTGGNIQVKWKKTSNAAGYVIYRSVNGGSYKKVKTITGSSTLKWTDTSVSAGRVYRYKIRAYQKSGSTTAYSASYSSVKKVTAKPAKASITSSSSTKKRTATLKWKKVSGATGYQVAYRIKGTSKWYYTTVSTNKKVFTLMRNKNYYVKVRAYTTYKGTKYYGPWSSQKLMTVKQ